MIKMKKFAGNKTVDQVLRQCRRDGVIVPPASMEAYLNGSDYLRLTDPNHWIMWNTFNGTFYGGDTGSHATKFDSTSTKHEAEPWFQALLSFFYAEKGEPRAERKASAVALTLGGIALLEQS